MDALLPEDRDAELWPKRLPEHSRAGGMDLVVSMMGDDGEGQQGPTYGFFEGCVQSAMGGHVNRMAAELMCWAGADVVSPPGQVCCGAIHHHAGEHAEAAELARRNLDAYPTDELAGIVNCAAGRRGDAAGVRATVER